MSSITFLLSITKINAMPYSFFMINIFRAYNDIMIGKEKKTGVPITKS